MTSHAEQNRILEKKFDLIFLIADLGMFADNDSITKRYHCL